MKPKKKLRIACCQFPVTGDIKKNSGYIRRFIREASAKKADIIQFPETALCGWGKWNNPTFKKFDFGVLRKETSAIKSLAAEKKIWVLLGSAHRLGSDFKPTNCLYVINDRGKIVDRYDKCWLTRTADETKSFTPGNRLTTFTLGGIKCGLIICADGNYLQMFNAYAHRGVGLLFYSLGHAGFKRDSAKIDQNWVSHMAFHYRMWIAVSNSSLRYSGLSACTADPTGGGILTQVLPRHKTGILYQDLDSSFKNYWTWGIKLAKLHPEEIFHNGTPSRHPRALNKRSLP